MNLRDVISSLSELPKEATIFAERIKGSFAPESRTVVLELSDEELRRPVGVIAKERAPGTAYFLEVSIATEFLQGWSASLGRQPSLSETCARLIQYADKDA
jgi:hypothetical protein